MIAAYRRNPTNDNYNALRKQVEINYDKVLARKKAKLAELQKTAGKSKIDEMQVIVDEMIKDRENRVNQSMARFTDKRLRPDSRKNTDGFLPVLGAPQNVNVAYTEVTNEEYALFIKATGRKTPLNWQKGSYPNGQANFRSSIFHTAMPKPIANGFPQKILRPHIDYRRSANGNLRRDICPKTPI